MTIHKRTRLTEMQRKEIARLYWQEQIRICDLCRRFSVTAPTIYKVIHRARGNDYSVHLSTNKRFRCLEYGLKRLSKIEAELEKRLKAQARRYNKDYPGEMVHGDTKRLPLITGETPTAQREYLFVAIDDFSRELYAAILPDKTQYSAERFLRQVIIECPYTIEQWYTDNGKEYKGDPDHHAFMTACTLATIEQRFTKVKTPQTNGKAERVIRTLMEMWHTKTQFNSRAHRKQELIRFVNWYNTVKPHKGIDNRTPMEQLTNYFYPTEL
ncbi:MAG: integrase core domain-containing protein [bacterium]|nr:integrase core domain-containing protein [bacterium]